MPRRSKVFLVTWPEIAEGDNIVVMSVTMLICIHESVTVKELYIQ